MGARGSTSDIQSLEVKSCLGHSRLCEESPHSVSCTGGSSQPSGGAAQGPGWGGPKSSSFSLPPKCGWFPASPFTLSPPGTTFLLRLQAIARSLSGDSQGLWAPAPSSSLSSRPQTSCLLEPSNWVPPRSATSGSASSDVITPPAKPLVSHGAPPSSGLASSQTPLSPPTSPGSLPGGLIHPPNVPPLSPVHTRMMAGLPVVPLPPGPLLIGSPRHHLMLSFLRPLGAPLLVGGQARVPTGLCVPARPLPALGPAWESHALSAPSLFTPPPG